MRIGNIWLGCKVTLALVIVASFVAPMALGEEQICTVSGSNFQLPVPYIVTKIEVSHSKSGPSGSVWLIDGNGVKYGPWNAQVRPDFMWVVYPNEYLKAGSYGLVDSDPKTYQEQAWIYGSAQEPTHQTPTLPNHTPQDPLDLRL